MTTPIDQILTAVTKTQVDVNAAAKVTDSLRNDQLAFKADWENAQGKAAEALQKIGRTASTIDDNTGDLERFAVAAAVAGAIGGTGESLVRMTRAFSEGRPHEGAAEILRMTGAACNLLVFAKDVFEKGSKLAKWLGPIGSIVAEVLSIGIAILDGYGPAQKSVGEQLKKELAEFQGTERLDMLDGLLDAYALAFANLRRRVPNSMTWDAVDAVGNVTDTATAVFLGAAENYLDRQRFTEIWPEVFEAYAYARCQALQNVMMALSLIKKFDTDGKPTQDLVNASDVIDEFIAQCDKFLARFGPIAVSNGTRWFIGGNTSIYRTERGEDTRVGPHDLAAIRLAVASADERVWHIGTNNRVYTGTDQGWNDVDGTDRTALAVTAIPNGAFGVYTIAGGRLGYQMWAPGWPQPPRVDSPFVNPPPFGGNLSELSVTIDGVYTLDVNGGLQLRDRASVHDLAGPANAKPGLVSATAEMVYVADGAKLWSKAARQILDGTVAWTAVTAPPASLKLPSGWRYADLHASEDNSLLAVINDRMYSLFNGTWSQVDGNTAKRVVKWPVRGYEFFNALAGTVADFKQTVAKVKKLKAPTTP